VLLIARLRLSLMTASLTFHTDFSRRLARLRAFRQTTEAGRHNPTLRLQPALRPGFILEIGDVYFRAFTRNSAALNDVVHAFSNVSCMITDALDVFDTK
jgi:hypothetical protein